MTEHSYYLDNRQGKKKVACPNCGQRRFTLYVDEDGNPLAPDVGRCDREQSCGYHKPPREYFREHPSLTNDWREWPVRLPKNGSGKQQPRTTQGTSAIINPPTFDTIPVNILDIFRSGLSNTECDFLEYFSPLLSDETTRRLVLVFRLGVTEAGDVVFPQIDIRGNVRTGHIMKYNRLTGHRIKDDNRHDRVIPIHYECMKRGLIAKDFKYQECFFGEHQLLLYPNYTGPICIVESEKTAFVLSAVYPNKIWMATGGINGLTAHKLRTIADWKIILYPDAGKGFEKWSEKAEEIRKEIPWIDITVSDYLETIATDAEKKDGIDIADIIIPLIERRNRNGRWGAGDSSGGMLQERQQTETDVPLDITTMRMIKQCISLEHQQEVSLLAAELEQTATAISSGAVTE